MTSQPGSQTSTIHILPNISQIKGKQALKFVQLIRYITKEIFFFKTQTENQTGWLVPNVFLFFKQALYEVKANYLQFDSNIFR